MQIERRTEKGSVCNWSLLFYGTDWAWEIIDKAAFRIRSAGMH
jgi:hypothetical protein